jgi:ATP-dependent RNA helicase DOB1
VEELLALTEQLARLRAELAAAVHAPKYALPFLQPGRLVRISAVADGSGSSSGSAPGVWGAVVNFERVGKQQQQDGKGQPALAAAAAVEEDGKKGGKAASYLVDVLVNCTPESVGQPSKR